MSAHTPDPELDLVLTRTVDVPPALVWRAWTDPELLKQWFAPRPWTTTAAQVDLTPGGVFATTMASPEGDEYPSAGCILVVEPEATLVFTSALAPGFRPAAVSEGAMPFTAIIELAADGSGTRYTATALHPNPESRAAHAEMGFLEGWSQCLDQLVEVARTL